MARSNRESDCSTHRPRSHSSLDLKWVRLLSLMLILLAGMAYLIGMGHSQLSERRGRAGGNGQEQVAQRGAQEALTPAAQAASATIAYVQLPSQAQEVYGLILQGGPFAYQQDGTTFGNYEQRLPTHNQGYYAEYTVSTPGVDHRGARRIVCGGEVRTHPQECYYTQDHYESFREIVGVPVQR